MKDFIFSINLVTPVFIIVLLGLVLKWKGIFSEGFLSSATTLVFYIALPAKLFQDVSTSDFASLMDVKFVLFIVGVTLIVFILVWAYAALILKDKSKISAFVQAVFRGNYVYVGLPITQNILQTEHIPSTILVIAFVLPLYNILAVIILSYYNRGEDKVKAGKLTLDIIKNPMIIAIVVALPFSLLRVKLPFAIMKPLDYMGTIAAPMALLLVGAGIRFDALLQNRKLIVNAAVLKVMILPLIFVPCAILLGFRSEEITTIFVLLAAPTAMNAYIMAKKLGGDGELSAGIIVLTVLLSVITLPVGAFILKSVGVI